MSVEVDFLGVRLPSPLMNAAGVSCTTDEQLDAVVASAAGAVVTKSCTLEQRQGNPEPRYCSTPWGSINSMGLPNAGYDYYHAYAAAFPARHTGKSLFFSMSGMSLEDNKAMATRLNALEGVNLELNLSCPNVVGKPQVGYDFGATEEYLRAVTEVYERPFGVKLPPYFDFAHFDAVADIVNEFDSLRFLTCINSIGNGLCIDVETESVMIKPKNGFGGVGGDFVLPTALANVNAFFARCPKKMINGCGGVRTGDDVFRHVLAGATLVQIGTRLWEEGPGVFGRVQGELKELMARKGYGSLGEFRGKVKTL